MQNCQNFEGNLQTQLVFPCALQILARFTIQERSLSRFSRLARITSIQAGLSKVIFFKANVSRKKTFPSQWFEFREFGKLVPRRCLFLGGAYSNLVAFLTEVYSILSVCRLKKKKKKKRKESPFYQFGENHEQKKKKIQRHFCLFK